MVLVAEPPGPRPLLPGRLLFEFRRDPIGLMMRIAKEYGDIARYRFAGVDVFQLNHPDYVREVLVTRNQDYIKPPFLRTYKRALGEGLLTSEDGFHDRQRRLMRPAFHNESINSYAKIMTDYAQTATEHWRDGEALEIHHEMMRLTLAIITKTMFSAEVEEQAEQVGQAITTVIEYLNGRIGLPFNALVERLPIPSSRRFRHATETLDRTINQIIMGRRSSGVDCNDLLSMLLEAQDPENEMAGMTDAQLHDEAITVFSAGHETTANALTWAWYLLSMHPEAEERLQAELKTVLDGRVPTVNDARKLSYTEMVLSETLRLYPPAWVIGREAKRDTTIGNYQVPKGSVPLMSQYVMHRDPRYFSEPERFDPDRWKPEPRARLPSFAYFPFGGGSRACIGEPFALMEGVLALATIAQNWKLHLVAGHRIELAPRITLRPKYGVMMTVSKRHVSTAQQAEKEPRLPLVVESSA